MLKVTKYVIQADTERGGYLIVPHPWERVVFPKSFATEGAAQAAVSVLERATQIGQEFIPVVCTDNVVRIYYIPSNFCPKQFLFDKTKFAFRNDFRSVSTAIGFIQENIEKMVF